MAWNFGDILDKISLVLPPDAPALIHGERIITWADTTRRSNNLARGLLAAFIRASRGLLPRRGGAHSSR